MFSRLIRLLAVAGLATVATGVAAAEPTVVETFPFSSVQFNQCANGETLLVTGTGHLIRRDTPEQIVYRSFVSNATAVAVESGATYRVTYQFGVASVFDSVDGAPSAFTVTQTIRFTRVGEDGAFVYGDDFMITAVFHRTVNPDSIVTTQVDDFRLSCQ
jgi:hypothetical protein